MSFLKLNKAKQLTDWLVLWPELAELLKDEALAIKKFTRLVKDSRLIEPDDVFFALTGTQQKGLDFIEQAWQKGALVVVTEGELALEKHPEGLLLKLPYLTERLGQLVALNTGAPLQAIKTQAITGTNGKSSIAHYLCQAWQFLGDRCALVGTLGNGELGQLQTATHTTPDLFLLHQLYADWAADGVRKIALEASSHALDQGRLDGLFMTSAIFTNLSRDHLDYHGSLDAYANAKQQLFLRPELETAVLNLDDAVSCQWLANLQQRVNPLKQLLGYSLKSSAANQKEWQAVTCLNVVKATYTLKGIKAELTYQQKNWHLNLPLLGAFNLANGLAVMAALLAENIAMPEVLKAMQQLKPVPGRMQRVVLAATTKQALPQTVVDYAHTPAALEQALLALRKHCQGKLWCVFGCGGDRDVGKRRLMGEVAERLADYVIVTDDNPRSESPAAIRQAILMSAGNGALEVADRQQAIQQAVNQAATDDWVLIAGKGHETWQEVAGERLHFNDAEQVLLALELRAAKL